MRKLIRFVLLSVGLLGVLSVPSMGKTVGFRTPFSDLLEKQVRQSGQVRQNPALGRLEFMRFYFPNNLVAEEPGFWAKVWACDTEVLTRAHAIYLYNMYVSTAAYQEDMPKELTVDYIGALDGFSKCANGFSVGKSVSFYQKHREEIQTILSQFFARRKLTGYQMNNADNQRREEAFVALLERGFSVRKKFPTYRVKGNLRFNGSLHEKESSLLTKAFQRSLATGKNKFLLFEQREVFGPQVDTPASRGGKVKKQVICRPANEECAACSYLLGKELCAQVASKKKNWGFMRLYRVTAYPTKEGLKTAEGKTSFKLANGQQSAAWDYHTAILAIMNLDGKYTPYVLDKFLAGQEPMSTQQWFSKFSQHETAFVIEPYQREQVVEEQFYIKETEDRYVPAYKN